MAELDAFELFAYYHLGLDRAWRYRFRNLTHAALYFDRSPAEIQAQLRVHRMSPEMVVHVPYALSKAHADVQVAEMTQTAADVEALARRIFDEYCQALTHAGEALAGLLSDEDFEIS